MNVYNKVYPVWDQVGSQGLGDRVRWQVDDHVYSQVKRQVWFQVCGQVCVQVGEQVWNQAFKEINR
jgi:hypothetical protein